MNDTSIKTIEHVRQFLNGLGALEFSIEGKDARYAWIQTLLLRFRHHQLGKAEKGLLLDFLQKVSGYSRIQVKRLSPHYLPTGHLQQRQCTVQGFRRTYTPEDIQLLAQPDEWHGTLSGPATKKLCERAWTYFGQTEYHRLAGISVAYLYLWRPSTTYQRVLQHFEKTRPTGSKLGERRNPQGQPGDLHVDTGNVEKAASGFFNIPIRQILSDPLMLKAPTREFVDQTSDGRLGVFDSNGPFTVNSGPPQPLT